MGDELDIDRSGPDLTPGDFRVADGAVEVDTDSLYDFSMSYFQDVQAFMINAAGPLGLATMDKDSDYGSAAIGKEAVFFEPYLVSVHLKEAATRAETLTKDLMYGNQALVWVAMVMSERYNGTDGFNAANLASAVTDAFNPPAGNDNTLAAVRNAAEAEERRIASLPQVDPSDVKFYLMSGQREGVDFVVAGTNPASTAHQPISLGNTTTTTNDDDAAQSARRTANRQYYSVPTETVTPLEAYVPPAPIDPRDTNAMRFRDDGTPDATLGIQLEEAQENAGPCAEAYITDDGTIAYRDNGTCA